MSIESTRSIYNTTIQNSKRKIHDYKRTPNFSRKSHPKHTIHYIKTALEDWNPFFSFQSSIQIILWQPLIIVLCFSMYDENKVLE